MKDVLRMAGEYASHAIWSVSDGETLIPIVGYLNADNRRAMTRLAMGSVQALAYGERTIAEAGTAGGGVHQRRCRHSGDRAD